MKTALLSLLFCLSINAYAVDDPDATPPIEVTCADTPDQVAQQSEHAKNCRMGIEIAKKCRFGSSADVEVSENTIKKCEQETKISKSDARLRNILVGRCDRAWKSKSGTIYQSMTAACKVSAYEFFLNLYSDID